MKTLIELVTKKEPIPDDIITEELYEICDRVHASCDSECPVYRLNGNKVVRGQEQYDEGDYDPGCDCFKNGTAMLKFIRNH